jgi:phage major head subunit gpT-like protein
MGIQVSALDETSEHAFKENEELYGLKASRNVDYGYWQHAVLATLS